jgi:hypothetical protein
MSKKGRSLIRGAFSDALDDRVRKAARPDPPAGDDRPVADGGWGYAANRWPGAPADRMPPGCPVIALGRDGEHYVFMDSMGALNRVKRTEWSKKTVLDLFAATPNFPLHHWARLSPPKGQRTDWIINGMDVDDAVQCLMHACAMEGTISIADTVRGRGAWTTGPLAALPGQGELVWHGGDGIYRLRGGKLEASGPTALEGTVYPGRAPVLSPWREPVPADQSPAAELFHDFLKTWSWGRPVLDPVLVLGWMGAALLGGALPWRPYLFVVGDRGVGKSQLQNLIKAVLGDTLLRTADATAAGIRQMLGADCLPVAVDELEASGDNRRVTGILDLARIAASADVAIRGGADHEATQFTIRSAMIFSAINPPPMTVADKSRMALITLEKLRKDRSGREPIIDDETVGRRLLRALMDAWPQFARIFDVWRRALRAADMSDRAQMTYGTLMALAELMLGPEALQAHGVPMESDGLGDWLKELTLSERAEQRANWTLCLDRLFGCTIAAWRDGVQPTVGDVIEAFRRGGSDMTLAAAQARLKLVGLSVRETDWDGTPRQFLAVPVSAELGPAKVFEGTQWQAGVWATALRQAPGHVVIRDRRNWQVMKINGRATQCLMVDLAALEALGQEEE